MSAVELKVGDKVRIIALSDELGEIAARDPHGAKIRGLVVGNTGTVTALDEEPNIAGTVSVRTDNAEIPQPKLFNRSGWPLLASELEVIRE